MTSPVNSSLDKVREDAKESSNEEPYNFGGRRYFSRKEIEENSPSRKDGINLKKETFFRNSYCTFLQELGMRLKVPQLTIATATIFCHRFFLFQSHAKNDRMTIATVCMFLAGKVEETPRPLTIVVILSYAIIHKKNPCAVQRIMQKKEVFKQVKESILLGERLVLVTLGFDVCVTHAYRPLLLAISKLNTAKHSFARVAWNFVNDGFTYLNLLLCTLRTSISLQFCPQHIAAAAMFLASKFLKVELSFDGEKFWLQEFGITLLQLEDINKQMLELYEQKRTAQPAHDNGTKHPTRETSTTGESLSDVKAGQEAQIPPPIGDIEPQESSNIDILKHDTKHESKIDLFHDPELVLRSHESIEEDPNTTIPTDGEGKSEQKCETAESLQGEYCSGKDVENPHQ